MASGRWRFYGDNDVEDRMQQKNMAQEKAGLNGDIGQWRSACACRRGPQARGSERWWTSGAWGSAKSQRPTAIRRRAGGLEGS